MANKQSFERIGALKATTSWFKAKQGSYADRKVADDGTFNSQRIVRNRSGGYFVPLSVVRAFGTDGCVN